MDTTKRHIYTVFTATVVLSVVVAGVSIGALSGGASAQVGNNGDAQLVLEPETGQTSPGGFIQYQIVITEVPSDGFSSVRFTVSLDDGSVGDIVGVQNSSRVRFFESSVSDDTATILAVDIGGTTSGGDIQPGDENVAIGTVNILASGTANPGDSTTISLDLSCEGGTCTDDSGSTQTLSTRDSTLEIT